MSIEVAAQLFLFVPSSPAGSPSDFDEYFSTGKREKEMPEIDVPFSHNHLHDLESLWWVTVWVVFYHSFSEGTTPRHRLTLQDATVQLNLARKLFPPGLESLSRHSSFQIGRPFKGICNQLPPNKKVACFGLVFLREHLIKHFMAIEAEYPLINPNASTDNIYDAFTQTFSGLKSRYHDFTLKPIQDIYVELLKPENKRPRSESTIDTGVARKNARK